MRMNFTRSAIAFLIAVLFGCSVSHAGDYDRKRSKRKAVPLKLTAKAIGPTAAMVESARDRAESSDAVRAELAGRNYAFISLEYIAKGNTDPTHFRVVFYDYTGDRTIVANGDFAGREPVTAKTELFKPIPNDDEFAKAVSVIRRDLTLGPSLFDNSMKAYRPMPDISVLPGTNERLINVGLTNTKGINEVVSVSLKNGYVIRYPEGAPSQSSAAPESCGIAGAGQATTSRGTAGSASLTVTQGPNTIWEMNITRPSASSGTRASGIELQTVKYKGKLVLKRSHTPVLNVQYPSGGCGPYRDWQYQEGMFQTPASGNNDVAPGIRIVASGQNASTALENGTDTGNFRGVAVYTAGTETVLVSELEAGWYRYIVEYRFDADGTIRPRFGFGATKNSCVCLAHHHHVYWRFDFDIVQANNKVFQIERGRKFLRPITNEMITNKRIQTNKGLLIQNSNGNEAYQLVPSVFDGNVDAFGVNDLWVLRYKSVAGGTPVQNELDDGINCTTCSTAFIQISGFANDETLTNQDIVVWYGAHFFHDDSENIMNPDRDPETLSGDHVVGPNLRAVRW